MRRSCSPSRHNAHRADGTPGQIVTFSIRRPCCQTKHSNSIVAVNRVGGGIAGSSRSPRRRQALSGRQARQPL